MKLLVAVAIGLIALIGSSNTGAAKSKLPPGTCEVILDGAKMSWQHMARYARSQWTLDERLREGQSYKEEYAKLRRKKEAQVKLMADYAQIYSAFCK
ncbi:MAG: hypothetical protein VX910_08830 [Candidatus Latescibacterota bacterium]|nr:hypothetical protein [Candidatus Latescibacterota bacterium]